jgi:hypothetical protein
MTQSAQAPDAATIEEMIRKGWAAFFGMAETHNKGLHDGYHFGWGLGFEVGREASIADALSEPLAPACAVPAKNPAYDKGFSIGYHKGFEIGTGDGHNAQKTLARRSAERAPGDLEL